MKKGIIFLGILIAVFLTGCAKPCDYSAFNESKPKSILVLLPENKTANIDATNAFFSQLTRPLSEAGYYVFPIALVEETFYQNGVTVAGEMRNVSTEKLRQIFGADAVLYLDVNQYGYSYGVLAGAPEVAASGTLVDLRTGKTIWNNQITVQGDSTSYFNLLGLLINRVFDTISDKYYPMAGMANSTLFNPESNRCFMYGQRSPLYKG
ncbi:DUF799 family lipoprotein [Orbus wheelerorum]|uniref:DUF799 domain-containing protein n=1 Tax=Orbus wheelerorum TaxID=3074111 RepID=UPI00370D4DB4